MTTDEHASPEALSAALDGQAPEWAAHLDGCARCRAELARLRVVSEAVGRRVPPLPAAAVERAVARALEAMAPAAGAGGGARERERVTRTPEPARGSGTVPLRRRSRAVVAWVASGSVAAVLLAVLAAVAVLDRGDDRPALDTALAPGAESSADRAFTGAPPPAAARVDPGGELGEVGDAATLAGRLAGRIPGTRGAPAAAAAAPDSAASRAGPGGTAGSGEALAASVPRPCEPEARAADPGLGQLVYAAEGTSEGRPVVVLGFRPGVAQVEPVSLRVLARDGCRLLFATTVS